MNWTFKWERANYGYNMWIFKCIVNYSYISCSKIYNPLCSKYWVSKVQLLSPIQYYYFKQLDCSTSVMLMHMKNRLRKNKCEIWSCNNLIRLLTSPNAFIANGTSISLLPFIWVCELKPILDSCVFQTDILFAALLPEI